MTVRPIDPTEAAALFEPLLARPLALAVSGGPDSMALLHLVAEWARGRALAVASGNPSEISPPPCGEGLGVGGIPTASVLRSPPPQPSPTRGEGDERPDADGEGESKEQFRLRPESSQTAEIIVITVDHRLRPEAAAEAAFVAAEAERLGLPHVTLVWDGAKPETRIQERAREARYALIARHLSSRPAERPWTLATAHHADDQAETLLMRLARGSGVDGLASMAPRTLLEIVPGHPMALVRPFLSLPKERLIATLVARGAPWCDDPSNEAPEFERVRVRQAMPQLAPLGLTSAALARSAARLARAKDALDRTTDQLARRSVDDHGGAYATCDLAALRDAPEEIAIRLLRRLVIAFGEPGAGPELAQGETLHGWIAGGGEGGTQSLGGALIEIGPSQHSIRDDGETPNQGLRIFREPGRKGLPTIEIAPGACACWDGRFNVALSPAYSGKMTIGPLGADSWYALKRDHQALESSGLPHRAAVTLPALRCKGVIVAVPLLAEIVPDLAGNEIEGKRRVFMIFRHRTTIFAGHLAKDSR